MFVINPLIHKIQIDIAFKLEFIATILLYFAGVYFTFPADSSFSADCYTESSEEKQL